MSDYFSAAKRDLFPSRTPLPDADRNASVIRIVKPDTFVTTSSASKNRIRATLRLVDREPGVSRTSWATLFAVV